MRYWRFSFRIWRHETADALRWKAAYALPRSIAYLAFIRVASTLGTCDSPIVQAMKNWKAGQGR
jgi:hypothetical protein